MTEEEFTGFKRKHYRVTSGVCWDACTAYRHRRLEVGKAQFDYAKTVGGEGFYAGSEEHVGNATSISAVIFEGDLPPGWKPRRWSSFKGLPRGQQAAWPDQRTKVGKEALIAIKTLPLLPSMDRILAPIGYPSCLQYTKGESRGTQGLGFINTANIGWLGETFYVSLPDLMGQKAKKVADGYEVSTPDWHPLDGMTEVLKEEVDLDYARAKLAKAA